MALSCLGATLGSQLWGGEWNLAAGGWGVGGKGTIWFWELRGGRSPSDRARRCFHTELVEVSASHFYHGNSLWAWDVLGWFWCQQQLPALHKAPCALLVGAWVLGDVQSIPGMCEGRKEGICCEPSQVSVSSRLL